ncbi:rhamnan synthesis F family protein [Solirhodobacter olei]|uniref:rhamnan synthesis F family protein n=1 Tax=Solirhodobacter olei TaxID=2493082 RepID=UPI000FDC7EED|nr:rhamnan synthesis F family protein [Solirhodobacter olei]
MIFPRGGVAGSHVAALDAFIAGGYAPLVVSNLPLSAEDQSTLLERSALLILRPNFGYDFGGYRDAILALGRARVAELERLVLANDSSWFPLPGASDWLDAAEDLGVDFAAATWHGAVRPRDPETFESIEWKIDKNRRNFHYGSYALSIGGSILSNPGFWQFWKRFRLTNDKNRTVRRGEIGLTRWVMKHGFSHGATAELESLADDLSRLDDAALDRVFRRTLVIADPDTRRRWQVSLCPDGATPVTRLQKEKAILALTAREGAVYALADHLVRDRGFAFLKKSPLAHDSRTARILLDTVSTLDGRFAKTISSEAKALCADHQLPLV